MSTRVDTDRRCMYAGYMNKTTSPYTDEARKSGQWTYVATMPLCDLNPAHGPAGYDARMKSGPWAFMCHHCWAEHAMSVRLGVGSGQALVLREEVK